MLNLLNVTQTNLVAFVYGIEKENFLKLAKIFGSNRCLDKDSNLR